MERAGKLGKMDDGMRKHVHLELPYQVLLYNGAVIRMMCMLLAAGAAVYPRLWCGTPDRDVSYESVM